MANGEALGMIETLGLTTAIEAADAVVKCAYVTSLSKVIVGGGIVTVLFRGDVASVNEAIKSGVLAASRIGLVLSSSVIARLDADAESILVEPCVKKLEEKTLELVDKEMDLKSEDKSLIKDKKVTTKNKARRKTV